VRRKRIYGKGYEANGDGKGYMEKDMRQSENYHPPTTILQETNETVDFNLYLT
jgi:hypothetical protein